MTQWLLSIKYLLRKVGINLEIIVVEQSYDPEECKELLCKVDKLLDPTIVYIQAFNQGFYNRGWGFNVGFRQFSNYDYFFFADNDIMLPIEQMYEVFMNCYKYEAVDPYEHVFDSLQCIHDSSKTESFLSSFYRGSFDTNNREFILSERSHTCFSGGIVGLSRQSVYLLSGWDERFRGRGWEDYAFSAKMFLFLDKIHTFPYNALHLYHPWEVNTTKEVNHALDDEYSKYNIDPYIILIINTVKTFGLSTKYSSVGNDEVKEFDDSYHKTLIPLFIERGRKAKLLYINVQELVCKKHHNLNDDEKCKLVYLNLCKQHDCSKCIELKIDPNMESGNHEDPHSKCSTPRSKHCTPDPKCKPKDPSTPHSSKHSSPHSKCSTPHSSKHSTPKHINSPKCKPDIIIEPVYIPIVIDNIRIPRCEEQCEY